jgi:hypothetical protein
MSASDVETVFEQIRSGGAEVGAVFAALSRFVETSGKTLIIKLTPRAKGVAACPALEDRPAGRAGAIPDRGFDGAVS